MRVILLRKLPPLKTRLRTRNKKEQAKISTDSVMTQILYLRIPHMT